VGVKIFAISFSVPASRGEHELCAILLKLCFGVLYSKKHYYGVEHSGIGWWWKMRVCGGTCLCLEISIIWYYICGQP